MTFFPDFSSPSTGSTGTTKTGYHLFSPCPQASPQGPYCHNEEHLTDPTSAERPPKGVRSGYRKSVNQVPVERGGRGPRVCLEHQTKIFGRIQESKLEEGKLFFF